MTIDGSATLPQERLFWNYLIERERIRLRRLRGMPRESWTDDPVFREWSFTNVKRIHDRVTTQLVRTFYDPYRVRRGIPTILPGTAPGVVLDGHPDPVALMQATLFRYHGTFESAKVIGWEDEWDSVRKDRILRANSRRWGRSETILTSAYIIPVRKHGVPKFESVLDIVDDVWTEAAHILDTGSWEDACARLCNVKGVGQFMAKEVLLDYRLATGWTPSDWQTWTPIGPGAVLGATVVRWDDLEDRVSVQVALEVCRHLYRRAPEFWPAEFPALDLTDIQFALCELAKYRKAQLHAEDPEEYKKRPKRRFRPTVDDITRAVVATRPEEQQE